MSFLTKLFDKKMMITFIQGLASGLPLLLTGDTLKALLTDANVDLATIGFFSFVGMPYTFKFLWSPVMDNVAPPFLGLRRGWMLLTQIALLISLFFLGSVNPTTNLSMLALLAITIAFMSASQDIVIDAYRREAFRGEEDRLGLASSYYTMGYRVGMLVSNAGALFLAQYLSWSACYQIMAAFMFIGIIATFLAPNVEVIKPEKRDFKTAIIGPFKDFFMRKGAAEILLFILLYKIGDNMASAMATPFYLKLGFLKTDIATIVKGVGLIATFAGGYLGGALMIKLGMKRSLVVFGILQMLSTFVFSYLAMSGKDYSVLTFTIGFENLTAGMGTSAYAGFMASMASTQFTATQYALLTSLMAIPRQLFGGFSGVLVENMGWVTYFVFCGLIALPGLLLITRFQKWEKAH